MSDSPSLAPGTLLADKFRIERLLGAGAMGAVYAIHHELTRHKRALKLLHPSARSVPDIVRRFLNEASAAGRAGNPHLVETFDAGTLPSGEPYVVMELLEGETLASLLEREQKLDAGPAAELVAQAAEGIEAAHGAGIIHRDLKPENLFVTRRDGRPFVKILDFGVSKFASTSAAGMSSTRAGMIYGSPAYMSPEQLLGSTDIDPRSDVFSLGSVLYQSVTGQLPFDAPTLDALAMRVLTGEATPIETLRPDLPPAFAALVRRALSAAREDRFPSARAFAEALAPFRERPVSEGASLGTADTLHSLPPAFALSDAPNTPRSRARLAWGSAAVLAFLALSVAFFRAHSSNAHGSSPAAAVSEARAPATPTRALVSLSQVSPRVPSAAGPAVLEAPTKALGAAPGFRASLVAARKPSAESAASAPTPLTSATARPSTAAENLGIRQDNPFR